MQTFLVIRLINTKVIHFDFPHFFQNLIKLWLTWSRNFGLWLEDINKTPPLAITEALSNHKSFLLNSKILVLQQLFAYKDINMKRDKSTFNQFSFGGESGNQMDCAKYFFWLKMSKLFFYEGLRPISTSIKEGLSVLRSTIVLFMN